MAQPNPYNGEWDDNQPWSDTLPWVDLPAHKGSWKGNKSNPAPNIVHEPIDRSEKRIALPSEESIFQTTPTGNRALEERRDTDTQKNFTISLYDIDETMLTQLNQFQLQIEDVGKKIKVPIFYGSPERWVSAQRDGYMRDQQGRIILPAIVIKRTTSADDDTLRFFHRYLHASVMKLYSTKNKYTQFTALTGKNAPVNEVYNIVVPDHLVLTYHMIIWTALAEQMNPLVETLKFNSMDYWGNRTGGFRFRVNIENFTHTVEIQANEDRMVKSECDLTVHGYILPDTMTKLDRHQMTTQKMLTPKKMVLGLETVATGFDFERMDRNKEKWRNPMYANLRKDTQIPGPPTTVDISLISGMPTIRVDNTPIFLRVVPVPTTQFSGGQDGDMSYDAEYFYLHTNHQWKRVAIAEFEPACSDGAPLTGTPGSIAFNSQFLYIYSKGSWRKIAIAGITPSPAGTEGDVMYDTNYIYIYKGGAWRRVAVAAF
jgi:hypothetical protein